MEVLHFCIFWCSFPNSHIMAYNQRMAVAHLKSYTNRNTIIRVSKTIVDLPMTQLVPEVVSHFVGTDSYPLVTLLRSGRGGGYSEKYQQANHLEWKIFPSFMPYTISILHFLSPFWTTTTTNQFICCYFSSSCPLIVFFCPDVNPVNPVPTAWWRTVFAPRSD